MTLPSLNQASYYLLYHKINSPTCDSSSSSLVEDQPARALLLPQGDDPKNHDINTKNKEEEEDHIFWEEFEWTPEQRVKAEQILTEHFIKSSIHSNHVTGRSKFIVDKLDKEAHFHWDKFYTSHQTNFFKDRHYLSKAFPEEFGVLYAATKETKNDTQQSIQPQLESQPQPQPKPQQIISLDSDTIANDFTIVEIGCGVGNTLLPLLELEPFFTYYTSTCNDMIQKTRRISIWGLDFSQVAIELLRQDARYIQASQQKRAMSAVWDITKSNPREIHPSLESGSDISLLLFCLSAISPDKMPQAAKNVADTLKPGGTLLIRDYGRYDEAQLKLGRSRGKCISENFYVKHDSTRVYYFELEDLDRLFGPSSAGLICIEKKYIQRVYRNRSDGTERRRVWVQARYRKPQHS